MSPQQDNKALIRRYLELVINGQDEEAAAELLTDDFTCHSWIEGQMQSRESFMEFIRFSHQAWEGWRITEQAMVAEGDRVAIRWTHHGRHVLEYQGFAPTGEVLEANGMAFYRIENGRIAELWLEAATYQHMAVRAAAS